MPCFHSLWVAGQVSNYTDETRNCVLQVNRLACGENSRSVLVWTGNQRRTWRCTLSCLCILKTSFAAEFWASLVYWESKVGSQIKENYNSQLAETKGTDTSFGCFQQSGTCDRADSSDFYVSRMKDIWNMLVENTSSCLTCKSKAASTGHERNIGSANTKWAEHKEKWFYFDITRRAAVFSSFSLSLFCVVQVFMSEIS